MAHYILVNMVLRSIGKRKKGMKEGKEVLTELQQHAKETEESNVPSN